MFQLQVAIRTADIAYNEYYCIGSGNRWRMISGLYIKFTICHSRHPFTKHNDKPQHGIQGVVILGFNVTIDNGILVTEINSSQY